MIDEYIKIYGKRLYGLCFHLCKNPSDADDLYQDTWVKVVCNISKYNPQMEFEPWLTRICVNIYRNKLRRFFRSALLSSEIEHKGSYIKSVNYKSEDYSYLHEAIDKLPEKYRITIILYYFKDKDIKSVSKILDVPEGTIKSRLNKARKLLKEVLGDEGYL